MTSNTVTFVVLVVVSAVGLIRYLIEMWTESGITSSWQQELRNPGLLQPQ